MKNFTLIPFDMTKYLRSFMLALPLLFLSFLFPSATLGATAPGLTIITHGYQPTDYMPQWPYMMSIGDTKENRPFCL